MPFDAPPRSPSSPPGRSRRGLKKSPRWRCGRAMGSWAARCFGLNGGSVRSGVPGVPEGGSTCKSAHFGPDDRAHATFAMPRMPSAARLGIFGRDARFDRSTRPSWCGRSARGAGGRRRARSHARRTCTSAHFESNPGAVYRFARHTCPGVTRLGNPSRYAHFDTSAGAPRPPSPAHCPATRQPKPRSTESPQPSRNRRYPASRLRPARHPASPDRAARESSGSASALRGRAHPFLRSSSVLTQGI
jgi:hypothetical protein